MTTRSDWYRRWGKRSLDVGVVLSSVIVWLPLIGLLAMLVRLTLGAPAFFRQVRPGVGCRPFAVLKFRTMTEAKEENGRLLPDGERLTRFGKCLRETSLDELPELFNVLRGEMSLVGPRPLLTHYLPLYNAAQARRHDVLPGITGLAQAAGRNALTWERKFELDVWYVDHLSLRLDLKVLWTTVLAVVQRNGINAEGAPTMPEFTGTTHER